ncbi:MAG: NADH-quinone oxidoreductase subunit M [Bacteroidota bacterium]
MITLLLILIPILGAVMVMFSGSDKNVRRNALIVSLAEFALSLVILSKFQNTGLPELSFSLPWIKGLGVNFHFAMDGISLLLVLLTTFLFPIIILASSAFQSRSLNIFYGLILIMEASLIGVFIAQDGIVFYIFWELALIPAYFIIALWGGKDRIRITFKFFIYTITGSLLMLGALIWLYLHTPYPHSGEFSALYKVAATRGDQIWLFAAFFIAFAIKIPIIPFHTWQPDTYTEAPAAGSMILAGVMLKMGIYGIIRLLIPFCHDVFPVLQTGITAMVVAGIIYASIIALKQNDLKRFVAWVSIAHVGLISAGALSLNPIALNGAVIQMISHGINVVGLFIIIDIIQTRFKSRDINQLGGLGKISPSLGILLMVILLGTIALPLTNGFVGEFMLLTGLFKYNALMAAFAGTTVIFSAVYMLRMYQKVMLGPIPEPFVTMPVKLSVKELAALIPLAVLVILIGCYPSPFLHLAEPAVKTILNYLIVTPY